jgi:hypothetical protein
MDVLKKSNVTSAGCRPLEAAAAVPTPEKVAPAGAAAPAADQTSPTGQAQMPGGCGGESRATVHPQDDGTCIIEVTCSCGNVIQVQCITQ